ncbi:MAG TPA: mannosyltransferase family protein [Pyrinomonadaceae bacterium]|nr:mannosyltransferase family protein [Pyrinomonadaceae bacterium]
MTEQDELTGAGEGRAAAWWGRLDRPLLGFMLGVKLLVFVYAVHAYHLLANHAPGVNGWLEIWSRWDAPHYLDLARDGYTNEGDQRLWLVFYPLYPWAVRAFAYLLTWGDFLLAALLVSCLASLAAGLLLRRLALLDDSETVSRLAVVFLFIFPTSYFLHAPYTESLFLSLVVACFLAARTNRWPLAGVLAALASLTRVNGLILMPALAVEAFTQYRATRRLDPRWLFIALGAAGFGGYLLLNKQVAGDWFAFTEIMRGHWGKELTWPWEGVAGIFKQAPSRTTTEFQSVVLQELLFLLLGLVWTVWCWLKLRPAYAVWMTLNWLLWASTSFILSTPRYTLVMFPAYILLARLAARRVFWGGLVALWSLLTLALFLGEYVRGNWAF